MFIRTLFTKNGQVDDETHIKRNNYVEHKNNDQILIMNASVSTETNGVTIFEGFTFYSNRKAYTA